MRIHTNGSRGFCGDGRRPGFAGFSAVAVLLLPFAVAAQAAIPPSNYVLKKVASKRAGAKTLRVRSSVSVLDGGFAGESSDTFRFRSVSVVDLAARSVRTRIHDEQGQLLLEGERKWGENAGEPRLPRDFASDAVSATTLSLLFETSAEALSRKISEAGIPVLQESAFRETEDEAARREHERMGLGRLGSAIAWVIGRDRGATLAREVRAVAESGVSGGGADASSKVETGPSVSQLWIQRETLTPLRLLLRASAGRKQGWDIRMESPKPLRDGNFPRRLTVMDVERLPENPFESAVPGSSSSRGGASALNAASRSEGSARVVAEEIVEVSVNPDLGGETPLAKSEWTAAGASLDAKSQRAIELYFRTLR